MLQKNTPVKVQNTKYFQVDYTLCKLLEFLLKIKKIHKSICVSTGSPLKLPVRVKNLENCAVTRMMKENFCQTDYIVKKNGCKLSCAS